MSRFTWGALAVLVVVRFAAAQAVTPAAATTPPGGANYFGAPQNQPFNPSTVFPPPAAPPAAPPPPALIPAVETPDGGLIPAPPPAPKIWSGSADLGVNGANGNSESFNFRANWNARRKTDSNIFTTDFVYSLSQQGELTNANQALFNARDEILFGTSPWSLYTSTLVEYDQLRDYDFRVGVYGGTSFRIIDTASTSLRGRVGVGALREFGSTNDRWLPELAFGYDFKYKFNDRSSFLSILDYYPRVDDFTNFRVRARAAFEYVLDPSCGMILRLGIQDRYDSDPGTSKKNDVTYFATLGLKF